MVGGSRESGLPRVASAVAPAPPMLKHHAASELAVTERRALAPVLCWSRSWCGHGSAPARRTTRCPRPKPRWRKPARTAPASRKCSRSLRRSWSSPSFGAPRGNALRAPVRAWVAWAVHCTGAQPLRVCTRAPAPPPPCSVHVARRFPPTPRRRPDPDPDPDLDPHPEPRLCCSCCVRVAAAVSSSWRTRWRRCRRR